MKAPRLPTRLTRWAAPALLAAGTVVSFVLAGLVQLGQEHRAGLNVATATEQIGRQIRSDIAAYGTVLRGLHGLFIGSGGVDRETFRQYVDNLRLLHDSALLQRFSFIVREGDAFVVRYVEPLAGNEALLGARLADFPPERDALARVMAGGGLTLSAPYRMERVSAGDTGLVAYLPLYATDDPARPYAATGRSTAALVGVTINLDKALRNIAEPLARRHIYFKLTELEQSWAAGQAQGRPFFDSARGAAPDVPAWLAASRELEVLGNRWRLDLAASPASMPPATRYAPQLTLALALALTLLLYLLVRNLGRLGTLATAQAKRMTQELRRSEELFRDLTELSSDWYWEQDADFRYTAMSGGVVNKGNFRIDASLGKARWELPIVGVSDEAWARHRAQLERHEPFRDFVYRIRAADGELHWYSVNGNPVFDADGRFTGYRGTGHDITRAKRTEQTLRDSEARLTLALEAAEAGLWDFDPVERITYFSPRFGELLGYPGGQALQDAFFVSEALHPDDRERVLAAQARALRDGVRFDETYRLHRKDGSYRWFRGLGQAHRDGTGQAVRFTGLLIDVTAQREAEQALRESEARLNKAQEVARLGSWQLDIPANRLEWSRETYRMFGVAPGTPLAYELFIGHVHADDRGKVDRAWGEAMRGAPYDIEHRIVVDGDTRWVHELAEFLFDAQGRAISATGTVLDITERKRAESQLRLAATVFENSLEGVTITDTEQRILSVNRAFSEITGYAADEVIGQTPRLLQSGRQDAGFYRAMWASIREKGCWRGEIWNRRRNGEVFPELLGISAVRNGGGEITHYIGMFTDISELKRSEEAMRRFNAELERRVAERTAALTSSNRELEAFSYSVSHDLRAPLRAIDGFAHILAEDYGDRLDAAARSHLARIRAASQRMALTTDAMLDLARLARTELQREDVDLSALAAAVVAELPQDPSRRPEFAIAPGLHAMADRELMHLVLQNLLHNAWKFTGKVASPRIAFGEIALDGERVFFVRDNGAGFDPAHAGRLFGAFQRLHHPDDFGGTGVGLATVARIVQRHGGRVRAEGAVGQGAAFYFTLG
ncbi:Phytochrome-like protein cph1 [Gammaproteobacteria bacterium]|nr:Phytochrome-like protein cph1 [Gammaproteobacteria bacterium]